MQESTDVLPSCLGPSWDGDWGRDCQGGRLGFGCHRAVSRSRLSAPITILYSILLTRVGKEPTDDRDLDSRVLQILVDQ